MKLKRFKYIILIILLTGFTSENKSIAPFLKEYKYSIIEAKEYYDEIKPEIEKQSRLYKTDSKVLSSIIFPELIRYSKFRDLLETWVLEQYYVDKGSEAANFSIGMFQIKPSFVEELELKVKSDSNLEIYSFIADYMNDNPRKIRESRLERIKNRDWQITYINCFYSIMEEKFIKEKFLNLEEKVRFYATAYNHSFSCTSKEIRKWEEIKTFPHGYKSKKKNYSYADISAYFYQQIKEES